MKKSIMLFAVLFTALSFSMSSCEKEKDEDNPSVTEGSYTLTIDGVTATEMSYSQVCRDGFFEIIGEDPSGNPVSIGTGEILVGETRDFCSVYLDVDDLQTCLDNDGSCVVSVVALESVYSNISGSITRTGEKTFTASGLLLAPIDYTEHTFTLEATVDTYIDFNCK